MFTRAEILALVRLGLKARLSPYQDPPEAGGQGLGSVVSVGKKTSTSSSEMGTKEKKCGKMHTKEEVTCCE